MKLVSLTLSLKKVNNFSQKTRGFTIVELLIVIVIIGILAALVIVAYSGIQQRANNAQRIAAAESLQKLLRLADVNGGTGLVEAGRYCLSDTVADLDGDGTKDCGEQGSSKKGTYNQALIDRLKVFSSKLPQGKPVFSYPTNPYYGPTLEFYPGWTLNGKYRPYIITYWLEGSQQVCPGTNVLFNYSDDDIGAVAPYPDREVILSPNKYAYTDEKATYCYVLVDLEN